MFNYISVRESTGDRHKGPVMPKAFPYHDIVIQHLGDAAGEACVPGHEQEWCWHPHRQKCLTFSTNINVYSSDQVALKITRLNAIINGFKDCDAEKSYYVIIKVMVKTHK